MAERTLKLIMSKSKQGCSLSKISELTGLTVDQVVGKLGQAINLSPEDLTIIFALRQEGSSLTQISQDYDIELEILKQFLTDHQEPTPVIKESVEGFERQIDELFDQGKRTNEISRLLGISENAVLAYTLGSADDCSTYCTVDSEQPPILFNSDASTTQGPLKPQPTQTPPKGPKQFMNDPQQATEDKYTKLIISRSKQGRSLGQISELTGLTVDTVKAKLGKATGLSPGDLSIIFTLRQEGSSLEQINQEFGVELEVLKQFLTDPTTTEETKEPPQPTKPQHSHMPTFLYSCEQDTNKLHRVNLLTGEKTCYAVPNFKVKSACRWSELPEGSLLITGGGFPGVKEAVRLDVGTFEVSSQALMHTARRNHASLYHSQYVYVLGGHDGMHLSACERFVCAESRWELLPPMPVAGQGMSAVELDNSLYALGGLARVDLDTVQKLSLDSLTWQLLQLKLPQAARYFPCFKTDTEVCLVIKETMYSFTPLEVEPLKTLPRSIGCWSSYYSRGSLYYEIGGGIKELDCRAVN
jgi:lambda repressor-like predicted transcriptional regulator